MGCQHNSHKIEAQIHEKVDNRPPGVQPPRAPLVFRGGEKYNFSMPKKPTETQKTANETAITTTAKNRPGNVFDLFSRYMFGKVMVFTNFLLNYGDQRFVSKIDLTKIELAPTHYINAEGNEGIADLVYRCPLKNGKGDTMAVIIFEHQSGSLRKIPFKLLKYIAGIWVAEAKEGKPLSAPYFIVLRTGKKPHNKPLPRLADMLPKDQNGKLIGTSIEFEYDVVDLPAWEFDKLVGCPELRLAVGMLKKMTEGKEFEFPEALRPLLEIADGEVVLDLLEVLLEFVAKVMGYRGLPFEKVVVTKALAPIFKKVKEIDTMIETIFDKKFAEGVAEGLARGEAIGEARGEAIGEARGEARGEAKVLQLQAEMLLTFIRSRFGRVPKAVERKIRDTKDKIVFESWAAHAGSCQTVKEFEEAIF